MKNINININASKLKLYKKIKLFKHTELKIVESKYNNLKTIEN